MLYSHLSVNAFGHLTLGGADTVVLAKKYGTPLYLLDEDVIRGMCRLWKRTMESAYGTDALPLYASKALSFKGIYGIVAEEGLGVDCVSPGEIHTAHAAGFPMEKVFFHGNNKTDADISFAMDAGVGVIVADSPEELCAIGREAVQRGTVQSVFLRVTPGIDPHTHKKITTGTVDSKFGLPISTGQAMELVGTALSTDGIRLDGIHAHIGSQIFLQQPFIDEARILLAFRRQIRDMFGYTVPALNLGGGPGVRYIEEDPEPDYAATIRAVAETVRAVCHEQNMPVPRIYAEPGRSLVAAAGVTLYTVGTVKTIPGFRTYVSVDGGMPDNPRYALYGSHYTALIANRADAPKDTLVTLAGRCCESGDLIGEDMPLQKAERGDIVAVLTTGAYNYSMASHYNRIPNPPVVLLHNGTDTLAVGRESYDDLIRSDL